MKDIEDGSIDLVPTDPPYGVTACRWDSIIPSGTTGVACYNLKRNFISIEKEERIYGLAKSRLEKLGCHL